MESLPALMQEQQDIQHPILRLILLMVMLTLPYQIKSEKLTPFGGIFSIMEKFDSMLSPVIDSTLGQRCPECNASQLECG